MVASRHPPGPRGLETLGFFGRGSFAETLSFLERQARRHGPIVSFRLAGRRLYLLDDPEFVRYVLVTHQHAFARATGAALLREIVGENLVTSEEPLHRARRRLMQPAFHRSRIAGYADVAAEESRRARDALRDGEAIDIGAVMTRLTLAVTGKTLFGSDVGERAHAMTRSLARALGVISRLGPILEVLPPWAAVAERRLPFPWHASFARARADLRAILGDAIARRADDRAGDDLLALVLRARDAGEAFDDGAVADELSTLLLAGHETTATAVTWASYLLANEPDARARLEAEVDALGEREPGFDDLPDLRVADAIFSETLRLYPPASAFGRRVAERCEIGGYAIEAGAGIVISPYVCHRNPRFFPSPERFSLARWDAPAWPEFAFVPFGGGARRCIGDAFARMAGVLALATFARRFSFDRTDVRPVRIASATLRPNRPIVLRVRARVRGAHGRTRTRP